jgi:alpha-D-xyloside xylohydrolase
VTGRPIARPFGLAWEGSTTADVHVDDQYFLGDHLLVAPVITAGQTSRSVMFPPLGDWYDWWTGEKVALSTIAAAPLDKLTLYLRGGGIVPMLRDTIDTLAATTVTGVESYANDPGMLVVRTAPGADQPPFVMFDQTTIDVGEGARTLELTPGRRFNQGTLFEVIGWRSAYGATATPTAVTDASIGVVTPRNSLAALQSATEGWFFDPAATGGTLRIKMPGAASLSVM